MFGLKAKQFTQINYSARMFIIALLIRLIPVLLSYNLGIGLDDMFQYDMLARSIESGNGYRWYAQDDLYLAQQYVDFDMSMVEYDPRGILTSFRPPLYPAFLAAIYFVFGTSAKRFFVVRFIQAFVGAALVPLAYAISEKIFPDKEKLGQTTAWIVTLYPLLAIYPLSLATENLFFLLVLLSLLILLVAEKERKWYWFALGGVLLGLTALTRSVALAFAGLVVLWLWFGLRNIKFASIFFLAVSLVTLPWMIRNTLLHHSPMGIESALGYDLYVGYHPDSTGTFQYGISLDLIPYLDDGLRDEIGQSKAIEFIKSNPERIPYLMIRRLGYFFGLERRALTYFYSNNYFGFIPKIPLLVISAILLIPFVVVSISSAFGFAVIKWNRSNNLIGLLILGYLVPHIFILGEDRFHLTLVPILAIAAAYSWGGGWRLIKERWQTTSGKIAILTAVCISLLLIINWGLELWRDRNLLMVLFGPEGNRSFFPY
jgi:4-amino-4-deoxy-L-arabinose transferase-like glycosyltransferase